VLGIDPAGKLPTEPGVVGHAVRLAEKNTAYGKAQAEAKRIEETQPRLPMDDVVLDPAMPYEEPDPEADDRGAKAMPQPEKPWLTPEAIGGLLSVIVGPLSALSSDSPVTWAFAAILVIGGLAAAYAAVARVRRQNREVAA